MKPIHFVFLWLLASAAITGYILMSDVPSGAAGMAHESIAELKVGGDGAARLATIGRAPFYFQISTIFLGVSLLYMGVSEHRRDRRFRVLMAGGTVFALFVWYKLYTGYEAYLATGETDLVFGFPVPTAWLLGGVWGSFFVFDLMFVVFFRDYFWPAEDEAAFEALVAELKTKPKAGDA